MTQKSTINPAPEPAHNSTYKTRFIAANGQRFEVLEAGEGTKLALCLHGFPESNFSWRHQIQLLVNLGYRVWAPNLRGYGNSSRPLGVRAYRLEALCNDIMGLIDAAHAHSITLIGHDWGGAIAWIIAIEKLRVIDRLIILNCPHPTCFTRALTTLAQIRCSWYMALFQIPDLPEYLLGAHDARGIARIFTSSTRDRSWLTREVLAHYQDNAKQPGALTAMLNYYRALARIPSIMGYRKNVNHIEIPVLLIWGDADLAFCPAVLDGTEDLVTQLTVIKFPGVSHWVQQEAPKEVNHAIATWLESQNQ